MGTKRKNKAKVLPHEERLIDRGELKDVTHPNASSRWLHAPSKSTLEGRTLCYRHMGDREFGYLLQNNTLPDTQPYQTLAKGIEGRSYCEKYFRCNKFVDTSPTTIVEFDCDEKFVASLWQLQSKIEDGTVSHGLGHKAGNTLESFNETIRDGQTSWRVVLVKRPPR